MDALYKVLCVVLGSSTVFFHDNLLADVQPLVHRLVSVVKMATMLQECTTIEQSSIVHFLRQ
jgi:hypothetical protein